MEDYAYLGQPFVPPTDDNEDYAYLGQPFILYQTPDIDLTVFFQLF